MWKKEIDMDFNKLLERLDKLREERFLNASQGFKFDLNTQCSFVFEEIGVEFLRAKNDYEKIDALCDTVVFQINALSLLNNGLDIFKSEFKYDFEMVGKHSYNITDILRNTLNSVGEESDIIGYFYSNVIASINIINEMGFDFFKCMDECLRKIESRKGAFNSETRKLEKFKDEESMKLWYKADYSKCKKIIDTLDYFGCNKIN